MIKIYGASDDLMYGDYETLRRENEILKAQMDILHLIFESR